MNSNKNIFKIILNTNIKLHTAVKLLYLQIKYPHLKFPTFLNLVVNLKTELLQLISGGSLLLSLSIYFLLKRK